VILSTVYVYDYCITNFGNLAGLTEISPNLQSHIIISGVTDAIVRSIFTYRVISLTSSKILAIVLILLNMLFLAAAFAYAAIYGTLSSNLHVNKIAFLQYLGYSSGIMADFIITASLCVTLSRQNKQGLREATSSALSELMIYAINTGALVGLLTIAELVTFAALPGTLIFQALYFILSPLYQNALLATLNARRRLRERVTKDYTIPLSIAGRSTLMTSQSSGQGASTSRIDKSHDRVLEVRIEKDTEVSV